MPLVPKALQAQLALRVNKVLLEKKGRKVKQVILVFKVKLVYKEYRVQLV